MKNRNEILKRGLILFLIFGFLGICFGEEEIKEKEEIKEVSRVSKEIQGEVAWIGKNKIAVTYSQEAQGELEILLPFDPEEIIIKHKAKIDEIKIGDIVRVAYDEITQENKLGEKRIDFKAKTITFVKPAQKKIETFTPEPEVYSSKEENLNFKGLKEE